MRMEHLTAVHKAAFLAEQNQSLEASIRKLREEAGDAESRHYQQASKMQSQIAQLQEMLSNR